MAPAQEVLSVAHNRLSIQLCFDFSNYGAWSAYETHYIQVARVRGILRNILGGRMPSDAGAEYPERGRGDENRRRC